MKRIFSLLALTLCMCAPLLAQAADKPVAKPAAKKAAKPKAATATKTVTAAGIGARPLPPRRARRRSR